MTRLTSPPTTKVPTWADYWSTVGNDTYLAAKRLAEISPRVKGVVEEFLRWDEQHWYDTDEAYDAGTPTSTTWTPRLDWEAYGERVANDRTMSSTEHRVATLVAALTTRPEYDVDDEQYDTPLGDALGGLSDWAPQVYGILVDWATGGRYKVVRR